MLSVEKRNKYYSVVYSDSLSHHGIKGQRWGKRNGPPYPLDAGDHSASEKKAGWRRSLSGGKHISRHAEKKQGFKLTDKQKKYLKIGAAVAVTGLAAYGAYKFGKNFNPSIYMKAGDIGGILNDASKLSEIANEIGVSRVKPGSIKDDIQKSNPFYNPNEQGYKHNCSNGSMAYVLRRLGFDCYAKPMSMEEDGGISIAEMGRYFRGIRSASSRLQVSDNSQESLTNQLLKMCNNENGAVGIMEIRTSNGGHYINWENDNGVIKLIDSQKPDFPDNAWFQLIDKFGIKNITAARVDDLEIVTRNLNKIVNFAK